MLTYSFKHFVLQVKNKETFSGDGYEHNSGIIKLVLSVRKRNRDRAKSINKPQ